MIDVYRTPLGSRQVEVFAPGPGQLDPFDDLSALFPPGRLYGLDVESIWMGDQGPWTPGWHTRTIQLSPDDDTVWVLRMDDPDQREVARAVLAEPSNTFTGHTQIDVLAADLDLGVDVAGRFIDTHWLSVMNAPDDVSGQASLKPVAKRFGMTELGEAEDRLHARFEQRYRAAHPELGKRAIKAKTVDEHGFNTIPVDDPDFVRYAGLDAVTVRRLVPKLTTGAAAPSSLLRTERWLSEQAIRLRRRGHLVDVEELQRIQRGAQAVEAEVKQVIGDVAGLTPTQGKRLVEYFGEHGADWSDHPRTPTGAPSLAKDNVLLLNAYPLDDDARAVASAYQRFVKVSDKLKRTAEVARCMDENHRVHPTLYTVGTVTSRMAAAEPNMQNFSKKDPEMRGMFIPEPGHVLMSCDFAQIELRVVAALSRCKSMIKTILDGGDLHSLTAALLGIERQLAKIVNFLIVYGGGGFRLSQQTGQELAYCRKVVKDYWAGYPEIAELNRYMTMQNGVQLISGRQVPTGRLKDGGSQAYANLNYLIQGSARELLAGAWHHFGTLAPGRAEMAWFPIHDELVLQVPEAMAEEVAAEVGQAMSFDFYGVPIKADADILIDRTGRSRWMTGDLAKAIRLEQAA